jgi:uncharacterized membrane protein YfcA
VNRPILLWGLGMCALATIGATVFDFESVHAPALLYGIGGFMVLLALVLTVTRRGENHPAHVQSLPDTSPPTTFAGLGFVLMAIGAVAGWWAVLIGAGMVVVGGFGILREGRAQRRALRRAKEGRP